MDLVENNSRQDLAVSEHRLENHQAGIIDLFGAAIDVPFDLAQLFIVESDQVEIQVNALLGAGVLKALGEAFAVEGVNQVFTDLGQVILAVGVVDMSEQFDALVHHVHSAAHQIPGGAHRPGVDISHGEHSTAQQRGELKRIDPVVLGFAPVDCFHIERMPRASLPKSRARPRRAFLILSGTSSMRFSMGYLYPYLGYRPMVSKYCK